MEHRDAVGHAQDLGQFGADQHDADAVARQARPCSLVDRELGADVDAARRLVEEQDARLAEQPFADDDLLLVAAREQARDLLPGDGVRMPSSSM